MPYSKKFIDTLYNNEWVRQRAHLNASELAREAQCSVPAAQSAFRRVGITPPGISTAKAGRIAPYKRKLSGEPVCRTTASRRAQVGCPPGPCVICGAPNASDVNHINRDWQDNRPSNLERLCPPCHKRQYSAENEVMYRAAIKDGADGFRSVFQQARQLIREGNFGSYEAMPIGSLEFEGVSRTLSEWAVLKGLALDTIRSRLKLGWNVERVLNTPAKKVERVEFQGIVSNLKEHAVRMGIPVGNVYSRLASGWSLERALTTPLRDG